MRIISVKIQNGENVKRTLFVLAALLAIVSLVAGCGTSENTELILFTTTSTDNSGLLSVLVPMFEKQTGYNVKTIAVGTGAALAMGERGEADVLLVHAPDSEVAFMAAGHGIERKLVMHNDFIIVGPTSDPAGTKGMTSAMDTLQKIADSEVIFISRGDDSGTNKLELKLWDALGYDPSGQSWYQETVQGMGATLTITSEKEAYTMTDRATYLATQENLDLDILVEGDPLFLNIYHVMQVNPDKTDMINAKAAEAFVDFIISDEAQETIRTFGVEEFGEPLFFPDANKTEADLGSI